MLVFWLSIIFMLGAALFVLLRPLCGRAAVRSIDANDAMVDIYQNRLREMEAEVASGVMSGADAEAARTELAHTLLQEADTDRGEHAATKLIAARHWWSAGVIALLVPAIAVLMYLRLGTPELVNAPLLAHGGVAGDPAHKASIEAMVIRLAERLEQKPDDPEGWMMLVNSYMTLGRPGEALGAIERLYQITGDQPVVLVRYADILATVNGGRLSGKPAELIQKALSLDPDNGNGLWLAGMVANETGDYATAIQYWQRLLPQLENDQESLQEVKQLISRAQNQSGNKDQEASVITTTETVATANKTITVNVSLSSDNVRDTEPEDTLFIFAKAVNGPPMPLAVVRKKVKDLPLEVILDDSLSMIPSMKLSNFDKIQVSARISKSGNATPQSGDYISEASIIASGQTEPVSIIINQQLP